MIDPIEDGIDRIYKNVLERGMTFDGNWSVSGTELMWLFQMGWQIRKKENLFATIASQLSVMYGEEIRVPSYLVSQNIGQNVVQGTYSFLPAEDGTDDWIVRLIIRDVVDGEIIED